jgi:GDP-L-fucose synthase
MDKNSRIFVAGHRGLAGSAICRTLERQGYTQLLLRTRCELDLFDQEAVSAFRCKGWRNSS